VENFSCPYCGGELSPPTRKRACPHCRKIIFARTRPNQSKAWVKEENLPIIAKEWADEMLKRDIEQYRKRGIEWLHIARNNIRECVKSGVVKSLKLYTAEDEAVCDVCRQMHGKIFPIQTPEQINFVMDNAHIKNCQNVGKNSYTGCRCYWRPEEISIE
jgi:hypothetical protein